MEKLFTMTLCVGQTTADADLKVKKEPTESANVNKVGCVAHKTGEENLKAEVNTSAENSANSVKTSRKGSGDQSRDERKRRCNLNQRYVSAKGVEIKPKEFDRNFDCRCQRQCTKKVDMSTRFHIFFQFWSSGSYEARCTLLNKNVKEIGKKRQYTKDESRRKKTRQHFLNGVLVCKKAFLATFSINQSRLDVALMKKRIGRVGDDRGVRRTCSSSKVARLLPTETNSELPKPGSKLRFLGPTGSRGFDKHFNCGCQRKCTERVDAETRFHIFVQFYSARSEKARYTLLNDNVEEIDKKRQYTKKESKRKKTRMHFLNGVQVCKTAFLATFDINQSKLDVALAKKRTDDVGHEHDKSGDKAPQPSDKNCKDPLKNGRKLTFLDQPHCLNAQGTDTKLRVFDRFFDCRCKRKCADKVEVEARFHIFSQYWSADTNEDRCALLNERVQEITKKRQYTKLESRRKKTRLHFLDGTQVCKQIFLATFAITPSRLDVAMTKKCTEDPGDDCGEGRCGTNCPAEDKIKRVEDHISQFRTLVAGSSSESTMSNPDFTLSQTYDSYLGKYAAPVSFSVFRHVFYSNFKLDENPTNYVQ